MEDNKGLIIAFCFLCGVSLDVAAMFSYQAPLDGIVLSFVALLFVTAAIWEFSVENSVWSFGPLIADLIMIGAIFSIHDPVKAKTYYETVLLITIVLPIMLPIMEVAVGYYCNKKHA